MPTFGTGTFTFYIPLAGVYKRQIRGIISQTILKDFLGSLFSTFLPYTFLKIRKLIGFGLFAEISLTLMKKVKKNLENWTKMAFIASFFQLAHIFGNGIFAFCIPLADSGYISRHNFQGEDSLQKHRR